MVTQHQLKSAKGFIPKARKLLRKRNFVKARDLAKYLKITSQRASDILRVLPEWRLYNNGGYKGRTWAREGYPL